MADSRISNLPAATALTGSELMAVVQGGTTKKSTVGIVPDIQTNVNAAQALLASSGSAIVTGQGYVLDGGGVTPLPSGITFIRVTGVDLPAGVKGFSNVAEAYVAALAKWVECVYIVSTNEIGGNIIVWAGDLSQSGSNDPTVDKTHVNLFTTAPTFAYVNTGQYWFISPLNFFSADNYIPNSNILDISGAIVYTNFYSAAKINIWTGIINDNFYDSSLNITYIQISVSLSELI